MRSAACATLEVSPSVQGQFFGLYRGIVRGDKASVLRAPVALLLLKFSITRMRFTLVRPGVAL